MLQLLHYLPVPHSLPLCAPPLQAGVDTHDLGITQTRSTPADWASQGYNLLEKGVFEAAARCFERAGDTARAQVGFVRQRGCRWGGWGA